MTDLDIHVPSRREILEQSYSVNELALRLQRHAQDQARLRNVTVAATAMRRALALEPNNPILMALLSGILHDECNYSEAEALARRAIGIEPNYSPAHGNLAAILGSLGRYEEAHKHYEEAIKLDPEFPDLHFNYAMSLLDGGKWAKAWPYYEQRITKSPKALYPDFPFPTWKGESLNGKTLHIQGEQGVGDRILFSRYIDWIKKEFPDVKINAMFSANDLPYIENLMWCYSDIVNFVPQGIPFPAADYGIFLMSLPLLHGTTPQNVPPDPGRFKKFISKNFAHALKIDTATDKTYLKVGVVWSGSRSMHRNAERNIPFEYILSLAELPNVSLHSLQFDNNDIFNYGADQLIFDLTHQIRPLGFPGTAACMMNLDLIITCCTSTAHLAGVLGVPTWIPLCSNPYWVWLRDRGDSVFYPGNVRLFRQAEMIGWDHPMTQVKDELRAYANSFQRKKAA